MNEQAVYDAVQSAFSFAGEAANHAANAWLHAGEIHGNPSAVYRPAISIDGNQWCALYGENLQDGVAGFGDSPEQAMAAFDEAWRAKLRRINEPGERE